MSFKIKNRPKRQKAPQPRSSRLLRGIASVTLALLALVMIVWLATKTKQNSSRRSTCVPSP